MIINLITVLERVGFRPTASGITVFVRESDIQGLQVRAPSRKKIIDKRIESTVTFLKFVQCNALPVWFLNFAIQKLFRI